MCGRFTLFAEFNDIIERFNIESSLQEELYSPSYNIAPSHSVLSVINDGVKNRLGYLKWGLIPHWARDEKIGYKMINARAETLTEKTSYREAYMKRRCLIIADSFYEWQQYNGNKKVPMRIKLKSSELFAIAGLWEKWKSPIGNTIFSCTILTTTPNELIKDIHDRMPVILQPEEEKIWLDPSIKNPKALDYLLKPLSNDLMDAYEVSSLVNSPKNNSPHLIQKIC